MELQADIIYNTLNSFKVFLHKNNIPYASTTKKQTHEILFHKVKSGSVQIDCPENKLGDLYQFFMENQHIPIMVCCNPKNKPARLFVDFDGDKHNIKRSDSQKAVDIVIETVKEICLLSDINCNPGYTFYKQNSSNFHFVSHIYKTENNRAYQTVFIQEIIKNIAVCDSFFDKDSIIKSFDTYCIGNRLAYSPKLDDSRFYKCNSELDGIRQRFISDPNYLGESHDLGRSCIDISAMSLQVQMNEKKDLYVSQANYERDFEISFKEACRLINNIPKIMFCDFYKWIIIIKKIGALLLGDSQEDTGSWNKRILTVLDKACRVSTYKDVDNSDFYDIESGKIKTNINKNGLTELQKFPDQDRHKKIEKLINKPVVFETRQWQIQNNKYISLKDLPPFKHCFIKSQTGTGKTFAIAEILKRDPNSRFIFISHRRSNLITVYSEWRRKGINCCHYEDPEIDEFISIFTTVESAHKQNHECHYIIIDEFISFMNQLQSGNLHSPEISLRFFNKLFQSNAQLIAADAYMNLEFINLFTEIYPDFSDCVRLVNVHKNKTDETFNIYTKDEQLYMMADADIIMKKRLVFVSDKKSTCKQIRERILTHNVPAGKILMITGENSGDPEIIEILEDINKHIVKYDYFIYSPSIEAGVSVEVNHFHAQYNHFSNKNQSVYSSLQQINRVRTKLDNKNHCYFLKSGCFRTKSQILKRIESRSKSIDKNDNLMNWSQIHEFINHPIMNLIIAARSMLSKHQANADAVFINELQGAGYKINLVRPLKLISGMTKHKKTIKKESLDKILAAEPIKRNQPELDQHKCENLKYELVQAYRTDDEDVIKKGYDWEALAIFKRRKNLFSYFAHLNNNDPMEYNNRLKERSNGRIEIESRLRLKQMLNDKITPVKEFYAFQLFTEVLHKLGNIDYTRIGTKISEADCKALGVHINSIDFNVYREVFNLTAKTWGKQWINIINNILGSCYGITFMKHPNKRDKVIVLTGYCPPRSFYETEDVVYDGFAIMFEDDEDNII